MDKGRRVCVKKILVSKVPLMRPTSDLQILEDARGTYIVWLSNTSLIIKIQVNICMGELIAKISRLFN